MWIRSQRKNALVNINFLRVINDGNYCLICGATTDGYDCELGVYSTKEKALKVLDEIKDAIEDTFYYNIENLGCGSYALKKGCEIYEMPQDDEVEVWRLMNSKKLEKNTIF